MNTFLLILILIVAVVTMVSSIISAIVITKHTKQEEMVGKLLKVFGVVLIVFIVILAAAGVSYFKDDSLSSNKTVTLETAGFNELSMDEYLELIKEDEKNIILVARPTCSYCELFTPILKEAKDDMDLDINYINTDSFTNEDWTKFNNSLSYLSEEDWGTPLTLIVQKSEVVADNGGYVDLSTIKTFFEENGFGE